MGLIPERNAEGDRVRGHSVKNVPKMDVFNSSFASVVTSTMHDHSTARGSTQELRQTLVAAAESDSSTALASEMEE